MSLADKLINKLKNIAYSEKIKIRFLNRQYCFQNFIPHHSCKMYFLTLLKYLNTGLQQQLNTQNKYLKKIKLSKIKIKIRKKQVNKLLRENWEKWRRLCLLMLDKEKCFLSSVEGSAHLLFCLFVCLFVYQWLQQPSSWDSKHLHRLFTLTNCHRVRSSIFHRWGFWDFWRVSPHSQLKRNRAAVQMLLSRLLSATFGLKPASDRFVRHPARTHPPSPTHPPKTALKLSAANEHAGCFSALYSHVLVTECSVISLLMNGLWAALMGGVRSQQAAWPWQIFRTHTWGNLSKGKEEEVLQAWNLIYGVMAGHPLHTSIHLPLPHTWAIHLRRILLLAAAAGKL